MHPSSDMQLPILTIGFSVLTGIGGARWVTNEVDKYVLRKSTAMAMHANPETTQHVMDASPLEVLKMAASQEAN